MKLNYKRTIFVGFAFFLICSFWQAYDNTIPLILTNKFGMSQAWSGVIMGLDIVLALFMLPRCLSEMAPNRGSMNRASTLSRAMMTPDQAWLMPKLLVRIRGMVLS